MNKVQELQNLSLATTYEVDNTFDSDKFIKMRLRVCHDNLNPNSSFFEVDDMEKAKDSIVNIPILANVIFDKDGNPQFGSHDMELEEDKTQENEYKLIYKETPIGLVPETCNHEIKEYNGKNYVFVDAYIWKDYSNYSENIIERDKEIKLSMEILIDAYSYNAKEKYYKITDYRYTGITFLNNDLGTGMENALATTGTFKEDDSKQKFIIMMEELKETLNQYNINNTKEGGSILDEQVKSLLEQYNVTIENLSFDIKDMSIEDIEIKLKEIYVETSSEEENIEESNNNEDNGNEDNNEEENIETQIEDKIEKFVKSYELSHSDIRYALYQLLAPVEMEDNQWYFVDQVYDNHFEYENWDGTKIYRQGYKKEEDNVSFENDRVKLFQERLTEEEKEALDAMRSNYSILVTENSQLKESNTSLQEFKSNVEATQKEAFEQQQTQLKKELVENFSKVLTAEEVKTVQDKDISAEDMEKEFKLLYAEKELQVKFSKKQKKTETEIPILFSKKSDNNSWTSCIRK